MAPPDLPPHGPHEDDARAEALALLALGEPLDAAMRGHIEDCPRCQAELAALRRTVALGRESAGALTPQTGPPPEVWTRIANELGLGADTNHGRGVSRQRLPASPTRVRGRRDRRAAVAVLVAAVLVAAGILAGYMAGRSAADGAQSLVAQARLAAMPGTPSAASGQVSLRQTGHGPQLFVDTGGLPAPMGFYEVWLLDPHTNTMVPLGALARDGTATLPLPPGLDVGAYHIVDISAQRYNGDPAHDTSVLRGSLAP